MTDAGNSYNFARINLTKALAYIDDIPRVTFTDVLTNGSTIGTNYTFVNLTASEPIYNATIYIDDSPVLMNGSDTIFYNYLTDLPDGSHNFSVQVTDSTGNKVNSSVYIFDVDNTAPI